VRTLATAFAACLFAAGCLPCEAAPFAVQLGDARVALDAPPGFADTGFTGSPRLQEHAESITSASNRVLLFAISDADLRRFMGGDPMELKRYMVIATPKNSERESLSAGGFARITGASLRELGAAPAAGTDYSRYLDSQPPGRAALLAELAREPTVVSVLQGTRLPPARRNDPPSYMLSTSTLLLVRGKALNLAAYTAYETDADLEWIRDITARWIEDMKRLNAR
jgi:hypothetical protein